MEIAEITKYAVTSKTGEGNLFGQITGFELVAGSCDLNLYIQNKDFFIVGRLTLSKVVSSSELVRIAEQNYYLLGRYARMEKTGEVRLYSTRQGIDHRDLVDVFYELKSKSLVGG